STEHPPPNSEPPLATNQVFLFLFFSSLSSQAHSDISEVVVIAFVMLSACSVHANNNSLFFLFFCKFFAFSIPSENLSARSLLSFFFVRRQAGGPASVQVGFNRRCVEYTVHCAHSASGLGLGDWKGGDHQGTQHLHRNQQVRI